MKTVGASEGKARFSALLDDAERGETTVVTKNGRPVARMSPITNGMSFREALKRVRKAKLRLRIGGIETADLPCGHV